MIPSTMRLAGLTIIGAVLLTGCASTQSVKTAPETVTVQAGDTGGQAGATQPAETTTEAADLSAKVGDTIALHGNDDGSEIAITLKQVIDPDQTYDKGQYSFEAPEQGQHYVSVKLRLQNVGSVVYADSPSNGAVLVDRDDQAYEAGVTFYTHSPDLGSPKIRPDDGRVGWITFSIPKGARLRTFQFTLDSGFGPETGEWTLR